MAEIQLKWLTIKGNLLAEETGNGRSAHDLKDSRDANNVVKTFPLSLRDSWLCFSTQCSQQLSACLPTRLNRREIFSLPETTPKFPGKGEDWPALGHGRTQSQSLWAEPWASVIGQALSHDLRRGDCTLNGSHIETIQSVGG